MAVGTPLDRPELVAPAPAYLIGGRRFGTDAPGFAEAIAAAHGAQATQFRPRCLCLVGGVEMYVARLAGSNEGFIVKRMPGTGSRHAPDCPSYEPPADFSGLGQLLGSAIDEDPATGETTLRLDFPMSKISGRSAVPASGGCSDSVATDGSRLSLRGLLHYLWDQAELTHWKPAFAGKRSWATVRRHLLQAAENKIARGDALKSRLYIPEVFSVEQRDEINARRIAQWAHAVASPGKPQPLMLLIAEVKEIVPARYGFKAVVKHVPDQGFGMNEQLYRRLGRRFETALALWGSADNLHMVMIATFGVSAAGLPAIVELSLMPVTGQWLPVEDSFELQLIERLVRDGRSFVKGLRYNLRQDGVLASAVLTDVEDTPAALFIAARANGDVGRSSAWECTSSGASWVWHAAAGAMPALPPRRAAPVPA